MDWTTLVAVAVVVVAAGWFIMRGRKKDAAVAPGKSTTGPVRAGGGKDVNESIE